MYKKQDLEKLFWESGLVSNPKQRLQYILLQIDPEEILVRCLDSQGSYTCSRILWEVMNNTEFGIQYIQDCYSVFNDKKVEK